MKKYIVGQRATDGALAGNRTASPMHTDRVPAYTGTRFRNNALPGPLTIRAPKTSHEVVLTVWT